MLENIIFQNSKYQILNGFIIDENTEFSVNHPIYGMIYTRIVVVLRIIARRNSSHHPMSWFPLCADFVYCTVYVLCSDVRSPLGRTGVGFFIFFFFTPHLRLRPTRPKRSFSFPPGQWYVVLRTYTYIYIYLSTLVGILNFNVRFLTNDAVAILSHHKWN